MLRRGRRKAGGAHAARGAPRGAEGCARNGERPPPPPIRNRHIPRAAMRDMASAARADAVFVGDKRVAVNGFETTDAEIVSYFGGLGESENLDRKLEQALRIGILAIRSTGESENVRFVEKAFESLRLAFDQRMDAAFGEDGQASAAIARHLGNDGTLVRELFNPDREGSPLHALREDMRRTLGEIRDKLGEQEAARQVAGKGTQKGRKFEEWCADGLNLAAKANADALDRTGDEGGSAGASKKGDFVATLGGSGAKVVFEMKDRDNIRTAEIKRELKEAMDNRDASYGVLVARKRSSLPDNVGWFNEYENGTMLVCAVEDAEGNAVMNGEMVVMAYRWARARAAAAALAAGAAAARDKGVVDAQAVAAKAKEIGERVAGMSRAKGECTKIENSAKRIREIAKEAEDGAAAGVAAIITSLESERGA